MCQWPARPNQAGSAHVPSSIHMAKLAKSLRKEARKSKLRHGSKTKRHHASAQGGSPSPRGMAKKPAIGGEGKASLTDKYFQRSQNWNLHFTPGTIKVALPAILKLNKNKQFLLAGSNPVVDGLVIRLIWRTAVTGKTVYGFFRLHAPTSLGPEGSARPINFVPGLARLTGAAIGADASQHLWQNLPFSTLAWEPYPPLPSEYAMASFDNRSLALSRHVEAMKEAIGEFGFIILPACIPEHISSLAFDEATNYFMGVMASFEYGLGEVLQTMGMKGFDELAKLPSAVWERKAQSPVTLTFEAGPLGMTVDPGTMEVKHVPCAGQAFLMGVKTGWVVARIGAKATNKKVRQPLAAGVIEGHLPRSAEITFQPPSHCSPLAKSQKWGVHTSKGYQPKLGLGKSTDPINFSTSHGVMNAQLWMRNLLASLHGCLPTELCWQPDGVSFKAGHT